MKILSYIQQNSIYHNFFITTYKWYPLLLFVVVVVVVSITAGTHIYLSREFEKAGTPWYEIKDVVLDKTRPIRTGAGHCSEEQLGTSTAGGPLFWEIFVQSSSQFPPNTHLKILSKLKMLYFQNARY